MTNIRANTDSKFLLKYLLIGIGCIAFGLWAVYDTFVTSPIKMEKAKALAHLKEEFPEDALWQQKWKELAVEKGWVQKGRVDGKEAMVAERRPTESPKDVKYFLAWQYIFMGLGFGIGLPCLIWYLKNRGTWIEADAEGMTSSWGKNVRFDQIKTFDKKKWEKKGIGIVHLESGEKFIVDDLKYNRKDMDAIVRLLESKISKDMIVNGAPEMVAGTAPADATSKTEENATETSG